MGIRVSVTDKGQRQYTNLDQKDRAVFNIHTQCSMLGAEGQGLVVSG